jgi:methylthioribose-1-phosphate isomerase
VKPRTPGILPERADVISPWIWTEKALYLLDQRLLPHKEKYIKCETSGQVKKAIKDMVVRGAPAIGITAAIGFYLGIRRYLIKGKATPGTLKFQAKRLFQVLSSARPTAVNLFWALKRMQEVLTAFNFSTHPQIIKALKEEALRIWQEDVNANLKMAEFGAELLPEGNILTHCNTGALATGGYGTALGVIRKAYQLGKVKKVWVDETRPFLQGSRLTAWELSKLSIPYCVIVDSSAGFLMQKGEVQAVIVGADRIAANGDTANKIGTYTLAVLCREHKIPFFVAAPSSTFDLSIKSGKEIPVEERDEREVLFCGGKEIAPQDATALNLAFDITSASLITAFITEKGIIKPPFEKNIPRVLANEN